MSSVDITLLELLHGGGVASTGCGSGWPRRAVTQRSAVYCRGLKQLIKESKEEQERQVGVAFSPRTTSLTVLRPRGQKPAEERFFESLEEEARTLSHACLPACMHCASLTLQPAPGAPEMNGPDRRWLLDKSSSCEA